MNARIPPRGRRILILGFGVAAALAAWLLIGQVMMRPVVETAESPDSAHSARLFHLYDEGGPAPYGAEVTLAAAGDPFGRFAGATLWVGYCAKAHLAWRRADRLELVCSSHPDDRDVYLAPAQRGVSFRVVRQSDCAG